MSRHTKTIDTVVEQVISAVSEKAKGLPHDRTVFAKITAVIDAVSYKAEYAGNVYSAFSVNGNKYTVGDSVIMTFMEGSSRSIVIIGKKT